MNEVKTSIASGVLLKMSRLPRQAITVEWLREGQPPSDMRPAGRSGLIFDPACKSFAGVQKGSRANARREATLGRYQNAHIRHYHKQIGNYSNG